MFCKLRITPAILLLAICTSPLLGSECATCHAAKGVRESTPAVEPITIKADGAVRKISLADAFRVHGHSCPGITTTFRALQYGLLLLFDKEIPEQKDLAIVVRTPISGGLDLLDLVMIGEDRKQKTAPPKGMMASRDSFIYTLYRKSTSTAVDIRLKPEHFPKDFFDYKKKQSEKKLSSEEWQVLHDYMKEIILKFPTMSFEDLFGKPKPYKTIMWGTLMPAHQSSTSFTVND
ncbi:MAG: hypothetical protein JXA73_14095 [Acidobacteria bacterium]|nr:hypothetical protein [Acidobacteriota bacterium]